MTSPRPLSKQAELDRRAHELAKHRYTARLTIKEKTGKDAGVYARMVEIMEVQSMRRAIKPLPTPNAGRIYRLLQERVHNSVDSAVRYCYRTPSGRWAGGNAEIHVSESPTPSARGESRKAWSSNGKWSGHNVTFSVAIQYGWRKLPANIRIAGNLLTTQTREIEDGLYEASWIEQGKGFNLKSVSGFIAVRGDVVMHGKTLKAIAKQVNLKEQAQEAERLAPLVKDTPACVLCATFPSLEIRFSDSITGGNCIPGTESWIEKNFPRRKSGKLQELTDFCSDKYVSVAVRACVIRHLADSKRQAAMTEALKRANETTTSITVARA